MNPISNRLHIGTLGELLVQIRLLQFDVQAAAPMKDSGNDLIAVRGEVFRAISVRTTTSGRFRRPETARKYHLLAVVDLKGEEDSIYLDRSDIFLLPREVVGQVPARCSALQRFLLTREAVETLFGEDAADPLLGAPERFRDAFR